VRKGARVLDVFSYLGAWGVRAARSGASEVLCVDSSQSALDLAVQNGERNGFYRVGAQGRRLRRARGAGRGRRPVRCRDRGSAGFCQRRKDLPKALAAYKRLNQLAMLLLSSDGILVSCSCSYHVSAEDLQDAVAKAARASEKHLQILEVRRPGARPPGASGDPGNAVFESLFLSRDRRFKVERMLTYPNINPIAVSIGPFFGIGPLRVHWYGIMYLIGFVAAWWLARYRARQPGSTWTALDIDDLIFYCSVGVIVGGRVGWCIFYGHDVIAESG